MRLLFLLLLEKQNLVSRLLFCTPTAPTTDPPPILETKGVAILALDIKKRDDLKNTNL